MIEYLDDKYLKCYFYLIASFGTCMLNSKKASKKLLKKLLREKSYEKVKMCQNHENSPLSLKLKNFDENKTFITSENCF